MATQDLTNTDAALKIFYETRMTRYLNRKVVLRAKLKRATRGFSGRQYRFNLYIRAGYSVGSRGELEQLPANIVETDVNGVVTSKYHYVTVEVSGPLEAATREDRGAWYRVKPELIKRKTENFADQMDRQYSTMNGRGILCEASTVAASGSNYLVTIKGYGASFDNADAWAPSTTRFIKSGMLLAWGRANTAAATQFTSTGGAGAGYGSVVSKGTGANRTTQFTVSLLDGVAPIANDVFVLGDGTGKTNHSYNKEAVGLRGIINDADDDFESVDTGVYPEWQSHVTLSDAGAGNERPVDEDLMQQQYDWVSDNSSVEYPDVILCGRATRRAYINSLRGKAGERYAPTKFTGGTSVLTFDGGSGPTAILASKNLEEREMLFISMEDIELAMQREWSFYDGGGGVWRPMEGVDGEQAYAKEYSQLMSRNRAAHAVLRDITVTGVLN